MQKYISAEDAAHQDECRKHIAEYVRLLTEKLHRKPIAQVCAFGCQQNEADAQIIAAELSSYGYDIVMGEAIDAVPEVYIMNTCAVREHAELKALSKAGNLKLKKAQNPYLITGIGGCMVQQEHKLDAVKHSYPYVDIIFGTNSLPHFPEMFESAVFGQKRVFHIEENDGYLPEGMSVYRESKEKAYVSIMYGCNNFCSYCIVPYVRGRERSREEEHILSEVKDLVKRGYKEITLLGQNVNSYGKDLVPTVSFAKLCDDICKTDGDFTVKFMTSHPKDVSDELIECIARNKKMARYIHFPIQSGSDGVLKAMNRRYTFEQYYEKVRKIKKLIPDAALSTDIIVGFPGETDEDFEKTLEAVRLIRYDAIFTFIYSKREGTPAATAENQVPEKVKNARMKRLLELQTEVMGEINKSLEGVTVSAMIEGVSKKDEKMMSARTETNKIIHIPYCGELHRGDEVKIKITKAQSYQMFGELVK